MYFSISSGAWLIQWLDMDEDFDPELIGTVILIKYFRIMKFSSVIFYKKLIFLENYEILVIKIFSLVNGVSNSDIKLYTSI